MKSKGFIKDVHVQGIFSEVEHSWLRNNLPKHFSEKNCKKKIIIYLEMHGRQSSRKGAKNVKDIKELISKRVKKHNWHGLLYDTYIKLQCNRFNQ